MIVSLVDALERCIENDDESDIWGAPGVRQLDVEVAALADLFIDRPQLRESIRQEVARLSNVWPLVLYIRRTSLLIKQIEDGRHLERGLAVAVMLDGRWDERDVIVSLVLLRASAEEANLDSIPFFDVAATWASDNVQVVLQNAKRRPKSSFESTISMFGPPVV